MFDIMLSDNISKITEGVNLGSESRDAVVFGRPGELIPSRKLGHNRDSEEYLARSSDAVWHYSQPTSVHLPNDTARLTDTVVLPVPPFPLATTSFMAWEPSVLTSVHRISRYEVSAVVGFDRLAHRANDVEVDHDAELIKQGYGLAAAS